MVRPSMEGPLLLRRLALCLAPAQALLALPPPPPQQLKPLEQFLLMQLLLRGEACEWCDVHHSMYVPRVPRRTSLGVMYVPRARPLTSLAHVPRARPSRTSLAHVPPHVPPVLCLACVGGVSPTPHPPHPTPSRARCSTARPG